MASPLPTGFFLFAAPKHLSLARLVSYPSTVNIHPPTQTGTLYHPHPPSSISFHKTLFAPPPHRALPLLAILNFPLPATPSPPLSHNDRLLSPPPALSIVCPRDLPFLSQPGARPSTRYLVILTFFAGCHYSTVHILPGTTPTRRQSLIHAASLARILALFRVSKSLQLIR